MTRDEIYQEMTRMLGLVPEFFRRTPDQTLEQDWALFKTFAFEETAIPAKYRDLIGLAVAATVQCPHCLYFHRESAKLNGATEQELNEAARIAMDTSGSSTFVAGAGIDLEQLKREVDAIMEHLRRLGQQKAA